MANEKNKQTEPRQRIIFMPERKTLLRLTVSFVILVLAIVSIAVFLLYSSIRDEIESQLFRRVRDASLIAARQAERSGVRWQNSNYERSRAFKGLFSDLYDIFEAMGLENIYIVDSKMRCLLKVKGPPTETAEEYVRILQEQWDRVFMGEVILSNIYPDKGKFWVSAYAPIFDPKGKASYVLGVDMDMYGLSIIDKAKKNLLIIFAITVLASWLMSLVLSYTFVSPIKNMVRAAEQIGLGNFNLNVPVRARDELGFLGQTMNDMIQDIRMRDEKITELSRGIIDDLKVYNKLIFKGMLNGVITFNLDGIIESINPVACRIFGVKESEFVGVSIFEQEERMGDVLAWVKRALTQDASFKSYEGTIKRGDREILVSCDFAPLIDREGKIVGHMLFIADVTEIKKLETQVKLKEKLAAIGELSAGIAHEIRNPLNSIELFMGLLQRKLEGQEDRIHLLGKVRQEVHKLNQILTDFLRFARPMPLNLETSDLRKVVEDSVFFAQGETDQRNIRLDIVLPDYSMTADIDRQQTQQAFTNIILNAAQAIEENGEITVRGGPGSSGYWELAFSDNGTGIPQENLGKIFDPFFTTKDEGTGLGLAMVHKIIETHAGSIDVASSPKGTTFTIQLPTKEDPFENNGKEAFA